MSGVKILVCQNSSCSSLGAVALIRDIEELAQGQCDVEEWGCLGKCGKGPNIEIQQKGQSPKVVQGVTSFKKAVSIVKDKGDVDVEGNVKKFGKMKFELRREEDAGLRLEKLMAAFTALGDMASAAKSEPRLLAELLVLRSKETLKSQAAAAFKDAQMACELAATWAQAKIALGAACEATGRAAEGVVALQEALDIGKCINKGGVKRQMTRLQRKVTEGAAGPTEPVAEPAALEPVAAPVVEKAAVAPKKKAPSAKKKAPVSDAKDSKNAGGLTRQVTDDKDSKKKKTPSDKKASDKKSGDKKDKDKKEPEQKEKNTEAAQEVVKVVEAEVASEPRSPLDFIEWKLESVSKLNHNCIFMVFKSIEMGITSKDADPGGVWHVDFLREQDSGQELKRAYTPLSNFDAYRKGVLEFMIKVYPDGQMTQQLASLEAGSRLLVSPPTSTENLEGFRELVMIAGGSAVTVAIQICEDALRRNPADVSVDLFLCNHLVEDVLYQDVFDGLLTRYPAFRLTHCISGAISEKRPGTNSRTIWHQGRVTKEVVKIEKPGTRCIVSGPRGLCRAAADVWRDLDQDTELLHVLDEIEPEKDTAELETAAPNATPEAQAAEIEAQPEEAALAVPEAKQVDAVVVSDPPPKKTAEPVSGISGIFCSLWKPFSCQGGRSADADDGEGVPAVGSA